MMPAVIPDWNAQGILPPRDPNDPFSPNRSPYVVSLSDVVVRFGLTAERRAILDGLLRYRAALHTVGLVSGFQWLDGSFLENIELLESRPPNDIDVVTFYRLPHGTTQASLAQQAGSLFPRSAGDLQAIKSRFLVDAYFRRLDVEPQGLVPSITYWYSMWSHRRAETWK